MLGEYVWKYCTAIFQTQILTHSKYMKLILSVTIDLLHKSYNAPVTYPTVHYFVTEMCTCVHISVTKWYIVLYVSDALWDLWDGSIEINVWQTTLTVIWSHRLTYNEFGINPHNMLRRILTRRSTSQDLHTWFKVGWICLVQADFIHILQIYFTGTLEIRGPFY